MILPGATLGMLGGGQLGRMFTVAARTMGYRVVVLDPDPDSPAGRIADEHLHAGYRDEWALTQLAQNCAVITTEFENVPAESLEFLELHGRVHPSSRALRLTQNRILEKELIRETGLKTAPFGAITDPASLETACAHIPGPWLLKRASYGYDGKGQASVADLGQAQAAFRKFDAAPCVLEQKIPLAREISVILGRSPRGEVTFFPVAENQHTHGILSYSLAPARVTEALAEEAKASAAALAKALDYCGVMAVEFFIDTAGALLVNEIAPRPHNSGHYTLDACISSQFEQQVRMICGLPAGDTHLLSPVAMANILGDLWTQGDPPWSRLLAHPRVKLHLYGKREARPGRKMGHFCYLDEHPEQALTTVHALMEQITTR